MKLSTYLSLLNRRQWIKILILGTVAQTAFADRPRRGKHRRRRPLPARAAAKKTVATSVPRPTIPPIAAPVLTPAKATSAPPLTVATMLTPGSNRSAIIPIRISDFPSLADLGTSTTIYFSDLRYPIVINRDLDGTFYALDPTCTHQLCQVGNYGTAEPFYMQCDCHGSLYTIEGRVAGGPALADLTRYPSQFDGDDLLEIELYDVPLRIDGIQVHTSTPLSTRLRLDFPGTSGCKYQVRYYSNLSASPQPALFSLTATGPADQPSFTVPEESANDPLSGNGPKALWVDAPGTTGFFAIEMVLGPSTPL